MSICGFAALCITASIAAEVSLKDDLGRQVTLRQPARRIVTLAPFLTELAFDAGAGERVVGASAFSDWPPAARRLPEVASAAGVDVEGIAALRPDLALAWKDSVRPEEIERLALLGTAVFVASSRTLDDVPRLLGAIAMLTGHEATDAAAGYERRLAALRAANAAKRRLTAFVEIWHRPLTTIAGPHFINEALAICGAVNVFGDLPGVAPQVSWEELYRRDPEVIVGMGSGTSAREFRAEWQSRATLAAVKAGRLVHVNPDRLQRATLRTPDGIAELCAGLDAAR